MTMPGEGTLKAIAVVALVLALVGIGWWISDAAKTRADFSNVQGQMKTLQASSDISLKTGHKAGQIIQESNNATIEDRRAMAAARAPSATDVDRQRVRGRALQAFAEGKDAACRMQRTDCGPAADPAPGE